MFQYFIILNLLRIFHKFLIKTTNGLELDFQYKENSNRDFSVLHSADTFTEFPFSKEVGEEGYLLNKDYP